MLSYNHIKHTQEMISSAAIDIRKANAFLNEIVEWVDAETFNMVIGTRAQFLRDRNAI
jgi:hypothetical protein